MGTSKGMLCLCMYHNIMSSELIEGKLLISFEVFVFGAKKYNFINYVPFKTVG